MPAKVKLQREHQLPSLSYHTFEKFIMVNSQDQIELITLMAPLFAYLMYLD